MSVHETQAATATINAEAFERRGRASRPLATLVFRWRDARTLVDLDHDGGISVGRSSACDVPIDEPSLSRQHARFCCEGALVKVEDLGSRNGVIVRGQRVQRDHLQSGEIAQLGDVTVSVHVFPKDRATDDSDIQGSILWAGRGMAELRREVEKIAPTPLPVLVLGETGCGKELIANELHRLSPRAKAPFQVVNCAAIPANLVESTLFGHERGAFTGADRAQPGAFEQAGSGTLFLDELGELPLAAQAVLLRVLESGRFTRVGSTREIESKARIVAATHRELGAMVERGEFRLDLLHRLDGVSLVVPPLRERVDALEPLVHLFLRRAEKRLGTPTRYVNEEAMNALRAYSWPGNVRELRNMIERAVAIAESPLLGPNDFPERLRKEPSPQLKPSYAAGPTIAPAAASLKDRHEQEERALLIRALEQTGGAQTEAAALLGWSLRTLQRRAQKYGLSRPRG